MTARAWRDRPVLVTGGASFIGSHLADALVERGAQVAVVDNLSSGRRENLQSHVDAGAVDLILGDLRDPAILGRAVRGQSVVFHLAANHGGRGYVDRNQVACAANLVLDGLVFEACHAARVEKVVYASSGCVYPNHLQARPEETLYLTEDLVRPPYDADNAYGWAKLMGEITLRAYFAERGMRSACCRYFTVYGPRATESHGLIAMIARAFIGQDPLEVWGTGEQVRNWTFVSDIVRGTILAAERIDDGRGVNLGTMERIRVLDAARAILRHTGVRTRIATRPDMPTGPYNRVAHNGLAKRLLAWEPEVPFADGLRRTLEWYVAARDRATVRAELARLADGR